MKKEFNPYEQALALKELGFDEPCFGWYTLEGDGAKPIFVFEYCLKQDIGLCLAPTFSQAFRFFRKNYGVKVISVGGDDSERYNYLIHLKDNTQVFGEKKDTYEEAELSCLNKLIEIVKNK
jgi:hypothetical protein